MSEWRGRVEARAERKRDAARDRLCRAEAKAKVLLTLLACEGNSDAQAVVLEWDAAQSEVLGVEAPVTIPAVVPVAGG